jgi:hypothetical protein
MLYNTKLNEFEPKQLAALLFITEEKIDELNRKLAAVSKFPDGTIKDDLTGPLEDMFNTFILWKVQILNAMADIEEMTMINAGVNILANR